jgi:hypothetical protein
MAITGEEFDVYDDLMETFEPIRDFFQHRQAKWLNAQASPVQLVTECRAAERDTFVFPGQTGVAAIQRDCQHVGYVNFSINPLHDRLYIGMIKIESEHQRRGIGLAVLWRLWQEHQLPLVPIQQYGASEPFWSAARRRFAAAGARLEDQLYVCQLEDAKQRWQHLVPESEVDKSIREYWEWVEAEHAVGRPAGLGIP